MASKDFFLDPDDAQTLGDINYMKKSVVVKHTFPRNLKNPDGFAVVKEVSSSEERKVSDRNQNKSASNIAPVQSKPQVTKQWQPKPQPSVEAATPDTSMNMFRNMAKNIRRK